MACKLYKLAKQMDIVLNNDLLTEAYEPGSLTSETPAWIGYCKKSTVLLAESYLQLLSTSFYMHM